jgi:phage gp36-like protein
MLIAAANDLAYWELLKRSSAVVTEEDRDRKEEALRKLRDISRGISALDVGDEPDAVGREVVTRVEIGSAVEGSTTGPPSIFKESWRDRF